MKFRINVPYLFDLNWMKSSHRLNVIEAQVEDHVLKAVVETKDVSKEFKEAVKREIEWVEPKFGPCMRKIEGLPYEEFRKSVETYEEAIYLVHWLTRELLAQGVSARSNFSSYLGTEYVLRVRKKSCSTYALIAGSILKGMGIETKFVRGVWADREQRIPTGALNKYTIYGEHAWNAIKIGDKWIEVDFINGGVPPKEIDVGLVAADDPIEILEKHLKFSMTYRTMDEVIQILD